MNAVKIEFRPYYRLTYIKHGKKTKTTKAIMDGKTPMEILIEARKNGDKPVNLTPLAECPAMIIIRTEG